MPVDFQETVLWLRQRIIWLDTLDLEPLPQRSSLLSAIFARIEDAVRKEHGDWNGFDNWMSSPNESGIEKAISDFDRLANEIAFAWDDGPGSGNTNSSRQEPEVVAHELRRAERARLSVRQRLDDVLNQFANHIRWRNGVKNPIFILPIDDFDLNPKRCLELLKILRAIDGARLFFLILGDQEVAYEVMRLKMYGELSQLAPQARYDNSNIKPLITSWASLADEAFRKLLPPDQRISLTNPSLEEQMAFKPALTTHEIKQNLREPKTIGELIQNTFPKNLFGDLGDDSPSIRTKPYTKYKSLTTYSGWKLFNCTIRKLNDLWTELDSCAIDEQEDGKHPRIRGLLSKMLADQLRTEPNLPDSWRVQLDSIPFDSAQLPVDVEPKLSLSNKYTSARTRNIRIDYYEFQGFRLTAKSPSNSNNSRSVGKDFVLNEEQQASFVLLNDLFDAKNREYNLRDATAVIAIPKLTRSLWSIGGKSLTCQWTVSPFGSFFAAERFLDSWNKISSVSPEIPNVDERFSVEALLAKFLVVYAFGSKSFNSQFQLLSNHRVVREIIYESTNMEYTNVIERLNKKTLRSDDIKNWSIDLPCFLAPERGSLNHSVVTELLSTELMQDLWSGNADRIKFHRKKNASEENNLIRTIMLNPRIFIIESREKLEVFMQSLRIYASKAEYIGFFSAEFLRNLDLLEGALGYVMSLFEKPQVQKLPGEDFSQHAFGIIESIKKQLSVILAPTSSTDKRKFRDAVSMVNQIIDFLWFLLNSFDVINMSLNSPLNSLGNGILCPDLRGND